MATATEEKKTEGEWKTGCSVDPFGVEACHPRNADLIIQCIPGCRLRSSISPAIRNVDGETVRTPTLTGAGTPPAVPGMQLHVNPGELSYVIIDPLHDNDELRAKVTQYIGRASGIRPTNPVNGLAPQRGTLDKHRMKTLVREILWLAEAGDVRINKGTLPDMEDVQELDGEFLLNPGARTENSFPTFERDWDAWMERLKMPEGRRD